MDLSLKKCLESIFGFISQTNVVLQDDSQGRVSCFARSLEFGQSEGRFITHNLLLKFFSDDMLVVSELLDHGGITG